MVRLDTWTDWQEWAKKQRKRISWSYVLDVFPPGQKEAHDIEFHARDGLDVLIRRYIADPRRWPTMTPIQKAMLYFRCEHVESLLKILAKSPVPAPSPDKFAEMAEWLFVVSWFWHGSHRWSDYQQWAHWAIQMGRPIPVPSRPEDGFAA